MMWGEADIPPNIKQIASRKEFTKTLYYLCNYSNKNDDKVQRLRHFPAKAHLCSDSGDLKPISFRIAQLSDLDLEDYELTLSSESYGHKFATFLRKEAKHA